MPEGTKKVKQLENGQRTSSRHAGRKREMCFRTDEPDVQAPTRADSAEGRRPSTGPEKRSAPRAGQRLDGAGASRWRPPARSLRDRNRL